MYNDIDYFVVLILISAHLPRYSLTTDPKDPTFARREKIDGARLLRVIRIVDLSTCSDLSINFLCSNLLCHIETVMNCYVVAKRQQAGIDCRYWQFLVCEQLLDKGHDC